MATHSSLLAWEIPWTEEPGELLSTGTQSQTRLKRLSSSSGSSIWASLVAQRVKNLTAMQETWVRSLDWEDPLEKEMATHSSIPAWRIPWTEEPGWLHSIESHRVRHG